MKNLIMDEHKIILDEIAWLLHPHWPDGFRKPYLPDQLPILLKQRLEKAQHNNEILDLLYMNYQDPSRSSSYIEPKALLHKMRRKLNGK